MNKYYGIPSTPTQDFLAHYGIPGMKWGVRRAIIKGNQRAFENHFRKAAKKLAKLQDRALNSGKYAAKAAGASSGLFFTQNRFRQRHGHLFADIPGKTIL